jgi:hypothetical protein
MKTKITSVIFVFLLLVSAGKAQEQQKEEEIKNSSSTFGVYSVSFFSGWYKPKMDYWNDTYLPEQGVTEDFSGNLFWGGNITFTLSDDFRARVGGSYWKDKVKGNENSTINSLEIAFTRFRVGAIYAPQNSIIFGFKPYVGAEAQFYIIKNKLNFGAEKTKQEGQDYAFVPLAGIERSFGHIIISGEFLYNLSSYTQDVNTGTSVNEQKISINGPEISVSVGYKF